jgi:hypothetical protein
MGLAFSNRFAGFRCERPRQLRSGPRRALVPESWVEVRAEWRQPAGSMPWAARASESPTRLRAPQCRDARIWPNPSHQASCFWILGKKTSPRKNDGGSVDFPTKSKRADERTLLSFAGGSRPPRAPQALGPRRSPACAPTTPPRGGSTSQAPDRCRPRQTNSSAYQRPRGSRTRKNSAPLLMRAR